jgi:charged multivesicular body protein 2A
MADIYATQLTDAPVGLTTVSSPLTSRQPVALGETSGTSHPPAGGDKPAGDGKASGGLSDEDLLQARLDALRRG